MSKRQFLWSSASCVAILFLVGCSSLISDFNRIDENKLRVVGVSYLPTPDVAPGDTVTARIYFAGNPITRVDNFTVAYSGVITMDTAIFEEKAINLTSSTSWLPDSFEYSFVIPDSVMIGKFEGWEDSATKDSVARFLLQPKAVIDSQLQRLSATDRDDWMNRIRKQTIGCCTFFSASAANGSSLRTYSRFAIRYNSRFPDVLPINHNPSISWVAVYAVPKESALGFDPSSAATIAGVSKTFLFNAFRPDSVDTIVKIDTGYSYFFAVDNGTRVHTDSAGIRLDTLQDIDIARDGTLLRENYSYNWFFQNADIVSEYLDSMLVIDKRATGSFMEFKPPTAVAMRRFRLWIAVRDQFPDWWVFRSTGVGIKGVTGVFEYTQAYRDLHTEK